MSQFIELPEGAQPLFVKLKLRAEITPEEEGGYFSRCPALDVFSQGETRKEAKDNLIEAVQLMIECQWESGTLDKWLKKRGFVFPSNFARAAARAARKKPAKSAPAAAPVSIPVEFPIAAYC